MFIVAAKDAYYAGKNKKYHDMFDIVPNRHLAKRFETREEAERIKNHLHLIDWTEFDVVEINEE